MKPRVEEAEAMAFILQHQFLHHAEDIIMDKTTEEKSVFSIFYLEENTRITNGTIFSTKLKIQNGLFTSFPLSLAEMMDRKIEHKKSPFVLKIRWLSEPVDFTSIVHTW